MLYTIHIWIIIIIAELAMDEICSWNRRRWTKVLYECVMLLLFCVIFRLNLNKFVFFFSLCRKRLNWFKSATTRASPWNRWWKDRDISIQKYNIKIIKQTIWTIFDFLLLLLPVVTIFSLRPQFLLFRSSNIENTNNFLSFSPLLFRSFSISISISRFSCLDYEIRSKILYTVWR